MLPTRLRRLSGFSYQGRWRYSLTFCTFERRAIFVSATVVALCVEHILHTAAECGFEVIAYCFMPDHLHLLVHGVTDKCHLTTFVKRAKQLSGYNGRRLVGQRIWQAGYFERILRADEDSKTVAAYILNNPLRARLVEDASEYPFYGSGVYEREELREYVGRPDVRPT